MPASQPPGARSAGRSALQCFTRAGRRAPVPIRFTAALDPGLPPLLGVATPQIDREFHALAGACVALILCAAFSTLRRSLMQTPVERVVESEPDLERRSRLRSRLERTRSLSTSASMFETAMMALFATLVVRWFSERHQVTW